MGVIVIVIVGIEAIAVVAFQHRQLKNLLSWQCDDSAATVPVIGWVGFCFCFDNVVVVSSTILAWKCCFSIHNTHWVGDSLNGDG